MRLSLALLTELLLVAVSPVAAVGGYQVAQLSAPPLEAHSEIHTISKRANIVQGSFDQLIDHNNPSLGTFKQRFWVNDEFYAGPGSPVVLNAPGENASDGYTGYTTNRTLPGEFGKRIGGAIVVIEHRYWGDSSPYAELSTKNLQYLTLDNAIQDLVYFAENVRFPFDKNGTSTPDKAPWVLTGCSYSGALTAWVNKIAPGTFWAYHASSAVVEAREELTEYFDVVGQAMPRNCSADVQKVMRYVDKVLTNGTDARKQELQTKFGLASLKHVDDFASALLDGFWGWQGVEFDTGYNSFHRFCDYVENRWPGSNSPQPDENGVGTCAATRGMAKWFREVDLPGSCSSYKYWSDPNSLECYNSYNATAPNYTDKTVRNPVNRQWQWMLCNEPFKWFFGNSAKTSNSFISKYVTQGYWERQCGYYFPAEGEYTYGIAKGKTTADVNKWTGGWDFVDTTRLMWAVGEFDPWRPATVASTTRPGGPLANTEQHPVRILPGAAHCGDLLQRNAAANKEVARIYNEEAENIVKWVDEWYAENGVQRPGKKN